MVSPNGTRATAVRPPTDAASQQPRISGIKMNTDSHASAPGRSIEFSSQPMV